MADALPTPTSTTGFVGRCWVFPPSDPFNAVQAINETMQERVIDIGADGIFLVGTGLVIKDNQIVVLLTHGGQANLYVCDSMEVNQ